MVPVAVGRAPETPVPSGTVSVAPEFATVFSEHLHYLWCALRRLGIRECDLEDVAHEVLVRVHAQLPQHDPEQPIRPWLFGLALGTAANYRRLARHRLELHAVPPEPLDQNPPADEHLIAGERRALVQKALELVPLQNRALLILHDMDEVTIPAAATALGIGLNTAYSRLRLGREAFRKALARLVAQGVSL